MKTAEQREKAKEQRETAIRRAIQVNHERATVRRAVGTGAMTISEALADPRSGSLTLAELLLARRGYGRYKVQRILAPHRLSERKRVRTLTDRQRQLLACACG